MRQLLRNKCSRPVCCVLALFTLVWTCGFVPSADGAKPRGTPKESDNASETPDLQMGREIFDRAWTHKDLFSGRGDGLGPMFNDVSCAACHHQQGSGGGGDASHNVDLLTVIEIQESSKDKLKTTTPSRQPLERLHPGLKTSSSITLHAASTQADYRTYRQALLGAGPVEVQPFGSEDSGPPISVRRVKRAGKELVQWDAFLLQQSQRNTPSLFGAGVIDKKITDAMLGTLSSRHTRATSPIQAGRFGWRGQTRTLREFVVGACSNELGLQAAGSLQAPSPVRPDYRRDQLDMTATQIDSLVEFVASLPPPRRLIPGNAKEKAVLKRGSDLFVSANCHACHVPDVGEVKGLYSDLQLHNMGDGLADPRAIALNDSASPVSKGKVPAATAAFFGSPYGGSGIVPATPSFDLAQNWRTPPLWGVRDSAPYLHDGRAKTLHDAIVMHGGEAAPSAGKYARMTSQQRKDLLAFVYSLGAP